MVRSRMIDRTLRLWLQWSTATSEMRVCGCGGSDGSRFGCRFFLLGCGWMMVTNNRCRFNCQFGWGFWRWDGFRVGQKILERKKSEPKFRVRICSHIIWWFKKAMDHKDRTIQSNSLENNETNGLLEGQS